jgi:hypothetical protein
VRDSRAEEHCLGEGYPHSAHDPAGCGNRKPLFQWHTAHPGHPGLAGALLQALG